MRNKIFIALLAVAVIVLTYLLLTTKNDIKDNGIEPAAKEAVKAEVKAVNKEIDKKGFEHAVISDRENVVKTIRELDTSAIRQRDSVIALLGIKEKQLKHWISYSTSLEGKMLQAQRTDSSFNYNDQWTKIEYVKGKDSTKNGHFNFQYNAEVSYTEYWKRKHFLAPKRHYIDFWINDPRATINGVKRVKIEAKPDKLGVEVNASSYYTDRLNIGFDGSVRVGRARLGGGYFYDILDGKWKPLVSVKFNLLDF